MTIIDGLLWEESEESFDFIELPPRIPEEDIIASRGACASSQYPGFMRPGPQNMKVQHQAKAMCAACPVLDECRIVADYLHENMPDSRWMAGIWAGETPIERERRLKREGRG